MASTLKDNSHVNPGCLPIVAVYWRIIDLDTALDILPTISGDPAAAISGEHALFTGGTFLEPEVNFDYFNGVTTQIKITKIIKDSCGKISNPAEMIAKVDDVTGDFEIDCGAGSSLAFANQVQSYTATYPDNTDITLVNIPTEPESVVVHKNQSFKLILNTDFTVAGNTVTILIGSTDPTVLDPDVFDITYTYNP